MALLKLSPSSWPRRCWSEEAWWACACPTPWQMCLCKTSSQCMNWKKIYIYIWVGPKEQRVPEVWIVPLLITLYLYTISQIAAHIIRSWLYIYRTRLGSQASFVVVKKKYPSIFFLECLSGDFTGFARTETLGASDRTFQLQPRMSVCTSPQRGRSSKLLVPAPSY